MGSTVYRPYPRRLESLTVCRCHYKGSTLFSVIKRQRPRVLVWFGFEPATSRSADRRPPNRANQAIHSHRTSPHFFISKYTLACLCCRGPIIYGTLMAMISSSPSVFAFMEQLMGRTHLKISDSSFEICLADVLTTTTKPSNSKC